jgi:uncharacterized membrane protein YciS (DUF1049 family)
VNIGEGCSWKKRRRRKRKKLSVLFISGMCLSFSILALSYLKSKVK